MADPDRQLHRRAVGLGAGFRGELAGGFLVTPGEVVRNPDTTIDSVTQIFVNAATAKFAGFDFGAHWGDGFRSAGWATTTAIYYTKADMIWPNGQVDHNIGTMVDASANLLTLATSGVILRYKAQPRVDRTQVFDISELGLVEMTRKRISEGLVEAFSETCPSCGGRGFLVDESML